MQYIVQIILIVICLVMIWRLHERIKNIEKLMVCLDNILKSQMDVNIQAQEAITFLSATLDMHQQGLEYIIKKTGISTTEPYSKAVH